MKIVLNGDTINLIAYPNTNILAICPEISHSFPKIKLNI
jgi:hypothetical protein